MDHIYWLIRQSWTGRWPSLPPELQPPFSKLSTRENASLPVRWRKQSAVIAVWWISSRTSSTTGCMKRTLSAGRGQVGLHRDMFRVRMLHHADLGRCVSRWPCSKSLPDWEDMENKEKRSEDKLPAGGMRLLPITAGICGVTYQGNGKYLTFNFLAVR